MSKLFYIQKSRIPNAFFENIVEGEHISFEGKTYERLDRRPLGRRPIKRLKSLNSDEQITIYA